ncbi:hypothetical protein B0H14DRAFT_3634276 [Mycena olivaceomarginata]|nr:hypothetical protein B0H14DRAFT_3634276 [Mycena olivaceomarginata]
MRVLASTRPSLAPAPAIVFATTARATRGRAQVELEYAGAARGVYQHSYLGYARPRVCTVAGLPPSPLLGLGKGGRQPCLAREMQRAVVSRAKSLTMGGANLSAFDACRPMVELVLAKGAVCVWGPLSAGAYGGVPRGCGAGVAQLLFEQA